MNSQIFLQLQKAFQIYYESYGLSRSVREEIVDFPCDLLLPNYHFVDGPSVSQHCVPMLLEDVLLVDCLMHLQLIDHPIILLKSLLQIPGDTHDFLLLFIRRFLPLVLPRCLDDTKQLFPRLRDFQHLVLYLVNHLFILQMLKVTLTLRRAFCLPVLKKNHQFSELELKELLGQPNELRDFMIEQIKERGELSIPNYWKQALTDERYGYYRQENVFSKEGDFTTAPEISTLFGEMVATWLAVFLQAKAVGALCPYSNKVEKPFRLVELGGGRGMLIQDILRSFNSYGIKQNFELCFIQISDYNRKEQQKRVMEEFKKQKIFFSFDYERSTPLREEFVCEDASKGMRLRWFSKLEDLVKEDYEDKKKEKHVPLTVFVMNEFFDALPITVLEYTEDGWKEKVLKLSNNPELPLSLENSSNQLHEKMLPNASNPQIGDRIELSPQSYIMMDMMAKIIKLTGGAILNIDYGGNGPFVDSIRAIKNHKYIPAPYYWQIPGACDLSAHVAFSALAQYAERVQGVKAFELVPQQFFLEAMGILTRVQQLSKGLNKSKLERLQSQLQRLTDPSQMGEFFKVQIIALKEYGEIYPHVTYNPNVY